MRALEIFYEICKIPHPSFDTKKLQHFIVDFATQHQCNVECDDSGNIHILKGNPRFCLQAHYDMVLIGESIEPIVKNGKLTAKDSSLGADNGVALACILALIETVENIEALITNDEEVGMIGANNLKLTIQSDSIINLDSEDISEIVVGCAGGFDADIALKTTKQPTTMNNIYKLEARNFIGGHSGLDINKGIKNAIVELLWTIHSIDCEIIDINGGEKRNSIPVNATAIIATNEILEILPPQNKPYIAITKLDENKKTHRESFSKNAIFPVLKIHNGIYEMSQSSVISSLNISMIDKQNVKIMVRANKDDLLSKQMKYLTLICGDDITFSGRYTPWEREDSTLLNDVKSLYKKHKIDYKIIEIHAGLECGILKNKYNAHAIISIGPTIKNPHSKNEWLDLVSLSQFYAVLEDLIK